MKLQNGNKKTFTITIASTKGGSAKSTNAANIGAFCAEHGLKTLLIDTDTQPTLSSYYELTYAAPGGTYELLHDKDVDPTHIISNTTKPSLHSGNIFILVTHSGTRHPSLQIYSIHTKSKIVLNSFEIENSPVATQCFAS